jgi:hypothetical protein
MQANLYNLILALLIPTIFTGCASITKDSNQPVKVETYSKNNTMV